MDKKHCVQLLFGHKVLRSKENEIFNAEVGKPAAHGPNADRVNIWCGPHQNLRHPI